MNINLVPLLLAIVIGGPSDPYVRTRTDSGQNSPPTGPFLFWGQNSVSYTQSALGNPETTGDDEFQAVTVSFQTWQQQMDACGALHLMEAPRTNSRLALFAEPGGGTQNIVLFRTKRCADEAPPSDACWANSNCHNQYDCWGGPGQSQDTIGLTTTTYSQVTGQILDADIELNAADFYFTANDFLPCPSGTESQSCVATDIRNTMTHEIGHLLGLDHTSASGSTMNDSAHPGETSKRSLDSGTADFVCAVYPKGLKFSAQSLAKEVGPSAGGCSTTGVALTPGLMGLVAVLRRRRRKRP